MDQTTLTDAAYEASDTLEQMAEGASDTPSLAAFLAETAALFRTLAHDLAAETARADRCAAHATDRGQTITDLQRRLALYETP